MDAASYIKKIAALGLGRGKPRRKSLSSYASEP